MLQSKQEFAKSLENICLELLYQGYHAMLSAKGYDVDWKEDKLTAHYIELMKGLKLCREMQISVIPQFPIYTDEHTWGDEEAETAPRIDFRFIKWFKDWEIDYFAEAKNLSEKGWNKKNGTYVSSSYYYRRYIETGIHHLLTSHYPSNCVLIAYILNGSANAVIGNINQLISSEYATYGIVEKPQATTVNEEFYISTNQIGKSNVVLKHLFLQLYILSV